MKSKFLTALLFGMFLIGLASAACTITLDKESYFSGETATATMSCGLGSEKNTAYTVNWSNGTAIVETDTGTTPNVVSQAFFETLNMPSGVNWTDANATLFLDSAFEAYDTFTLNDTGLTSSLIVKNITFTSASELFIGKTLGIRGLVYDENGNKISNANCQFDIEDGTSLPITSLTDTSHDGIAQTDFILNIDSFDESRQYLARVGCFCGASSTIGACVDENGAEVATSVGSATNTFTTLNWLTVNSVTSLNGSVDVGDEFSICANVTNNLTDDRLDIMVYYNWRCGSGSDSDTDRIVYGSYSQLRGISANTTQMQCHDFVVPNEEHIEKGSNICYGATDVSVLNEAGESLVTYATTSPQFNVTIYSIHPSIEFQRVSKNIYFANVSFDAFDVGIKNVHAIIDGDLNGGDTSLTSIVNYSVYYFNGTQVPYSTRIFFHEHAIRNQEVLVWDDAIEVEIADVNTTLDENFNLTVEFENYEERQTEALEGINNKTGTFHLDVECPVTGIIGSDMACVVTAYVEDSQIVEKEVDFTCFISDGTNEFSSVNFNQMVRRSAVSVSRDFAVPTSFNSGQQYVLQCYADYYNLGSRRDSFYDTFIANTATGGGGSSSGGGSENGEEGKGAPITGGAVDEGGLNIGEGIGDIIDKFNPFSPERNWALIFAGGIVLLGLIVAGFLFFVRNRKRVMSCNFRKLFSQILYVVFVVGILGLAVFGIVKLYNYLRGESSFISSLFQEVFFRDLVLAGFVILAAVIVLRVLNIRGEIRFGWNGSSRRYYNDRKSSKLQAKLNRMIIKDEIRRHQEGKR